MNFCFSKILLFEIREKNKCKPRHKHNQIWIGQSDSKRRMKMKRLNACGTRKRKTNKNECITCIARDLACFPTFVFPRNAILMRRHFEIFVSDCAKTMNSILLSGLCILVKKNMRTQNTKRIHSCQQLKFHRFF